MRNNLKLEDGREVEQTAGGRWRDVATGRFVPKDEVPQKQEPQHRNAALLRDIVGVVRQAGYRIDTLEDAWEVILGVQADIALDKEGGTKATSAAKFLREVLVPEGNQAVDPELVLGKELASKILTMIETETGGEDRGPGSE